MGISDKIKDAAAKVADKIPGVGDDESEGRSAPGADAQTGAGAPQPQGEGEGGVTDKIAAAAAKAAAERADQPGRTQDEVLEEGVSIPAPAVLKNMDASGKQVPTG